LILSRAGPRHVGMPGRLIIVRPFSAIFFKLFWARIGPINIFEVACPNC